MTSFYIDAHTEDKLKLTNNEGKSLKIKSSKRMSKLKSFIPTVAPDQITSQSIYPSFFEGLWIPDDPNSYVIYITENPQWGVPPAQIFFGKESVIYNNLDPNTSSGYLYLFLRNGVEIAMASVLTVGWNNKVSLSSSLLSSNNIMTINNNTIFSDGIWRKSFICNNWKNIDGILISISCEQVDPAKFKYKPYFNIMVSIGSVKLLGNMSYDVLTSKNSIKKVDLTNISYPQTDIQPINEFYSNLLSKDWTYDIVNNNLSVGILNGDQYIESIFSIYTTPEAIQYVSSGYYINISGETNINISDDGNTINGIYLYNQIKGNYDKKTGIITFDDHNRSTGSFSSDFFTLFAFGLSFTGLSGSILLRVYREDT